MIFKITVICSAKVFQLLFTNNAGNLFEQYLYINRQSAKIIIDQWYIFFKLSEYENKIMSCQPFAPSH